MVTMHYLSALTAGRFLCAVFTILSFSSPSQAQLTEEAAVSDLVSGLFANELIIVSCVLCGGDPVPYTLCVVSCKLCEGAGTH